MRARLLLCVIAVLSLAAYPAFAGSIVDIGLFETGTAASGDDPHWTLLGNGPAQVAFPFPGGWIANTTTSRWVGPIADVNSLSTAVDVRYTYWTWFDLSSYVLSSVSISGRWAVDDMAGLQTNSNPANLYTIDFDAGGSAYSTWHSFTLNSANLVSGVNILRITLDNKGNAALPSNPTGLRVEFTGFEGTLSSIPEPGTLLLMGGGLLALGLFRRRS